MKTNRIILSFALAVSGLSATPVSAQQIDPALTAAVLEQTMQLQQIHNKRKTLHEKIITAESAVTLAVDRVHSVEKKMLTYLSQAQAAMSNLYQLKRCVELVGDEIPEKIQMATDAIPGNLRGTVVSTIVSRQIHDVYAQMASLAPFMYQLVSSGTYNVPNAEGGTDRHRVNLLNSAERYYIANEVVTRLERINTDLWILAYQIKTLSWNNLWYALDPVGWHTIMDGRIRADFLIAQWRRL